MDIPLSFINSNWGGCSPYFHVIEEEMETYGG